MIFLQCMLSVRFNVNKADLPVGFLGKLSSIAAKAYSIRRHTRTQETRDLIPPTQRQSQVYSSACSSSAPFTLCAPLDVVLVVCCYSFVAHIHIEREADDDVPDCFGDNKHLQYCLVPSSQTESCEPGFLSVICLPFNSPFGRYTYLSRQPTAKVVMAFDNNSVNTFHKVTSTG